jgi:hypothetical protein
VESGFENSNWSWLYKMRISVYSKLSSYLLLFWVALFIWGCSENLEDRWVDIDYYVINTRLDEILVKNRDAANGIVGFFLCSGEVYHFGYHGKMAFKIMDDDPHGIHIIFDFYAPGDDASFTKHIGYYEFSPELDENHACVETCFVR